MSVNFYGPISVLPLGYGLSGAERFEERGVKASERTSVQ